jgi:hypothetical protein
LRAVFDRNYWPAVIGEKKVDAVADVLLDRNPKAVIAKIDADIMTDPNLGAEI